MKKNTRARNTAAPRPKNKPVMSPHALPRPRTTPGTAQLSAALLGLVLGAGACGAAATATAPEEGNDDAEGWSANGACLVDADCGADHFCALGRCTLGCVADDECEGDAVCDPHGRCGEPGRASLPLLVGSLPTPLPAGVHLLKVNNPSSADGWVRVQSSLSSVHVPSTAMPIAAGQTVEIELVVDEVFETEAHLGVLHIIGDMGTEVVPLGIPGSGSGRWTGSLVLGEGTPMAVAPLTLMLHKHDDGTLTGSTMREGSPLWPRDVTVTGTWTEEGAWTLEIRDLIPVTADEPLGAASEWTRAWVDRPIGRQLTVVGQLDEFGRLQAGVVETLSGLDLDDVHLFGSITLVRTGELETPAGVSDDSALVPVVPPQAAFAPLHETTACEGLATAYGTLNQLDNLSDAYACADCADGWCSAEAAYACGDALLALGDHLLEIFDELDVEQFGTAVPPGFVECADVPLETFNPCIDGRVLACSQALLREAHAEDPDAYGDPIALLDHDLRTITAASLLAYSDMVEGTLSWLDHPTNAITAELSHLERALARLATSFRPALDPGRLAVLDSVPNSVLRVDRGGRDLGDFAVTLAHVADVQTSLLRLAARAPGADAKGLRAAARWVLVHAHVAAALISHRALVHELGLGDAAGALRESTEAALSVHALLAPGGNPLGLPPSDVPLLLSTAQANTETTNFHLVHAAAQQAIADFAQRSDEAKATLAAFESAVYDAEQQAAAIREGYDVQLLDWCGAVAGDPTSPDLDACGSTSGRVHDLFLRVQAAGLQIDAATINLNSNLQAIEIQEDKLRELLVVAELLDATIAEQQTIISATKTGLFHDLDAARAARANADCSLKKAESRLKNATLWGAGLASGSLFSAKSAFGAVVGLGMQTATNIAECELACNHIYANANIDRNVALAQHIADAEITVASQTIDAALRASSFASQQIESLAQIKTMTLSNAALELGIRQAELDAELAEAALIDSIAQVESLRIRRQRAIDRLLADPDNPFLSPSFLTVRVELGRSLDERRESALRWVSRAARALELEIAAPLEGVQQRVVASRSPLELDAISACLEGLYLEHVLDFGGPQHLVTELSVRRDILGITEPVIDPVTGVEISPAEQFHAVLQAPDVLQLNGSVRLPFSISLAGDGSIAAEVLCQDRISGIEAQLVGDYLGDEAALVIVERRGQSMVRRCAAPSLPTDAQAMGFVLEPRASAIQAGVNAWGTAAVNAGLAGWPVAGESWTVVMPAAAQAPENADFAITDLDDIVLRIHHRAATVSHEPSPPPPIQCL